MEIDFWATRWKAGRIGFHEGRANAFLEKHVDRLGGHRRVLVPLCGKTEDMAFLAAHGHDVVGIEAVEDAAKAFFLEHALQPTVQDRRRGLRSYTAGAITILVADLFACTKEDVGSVDALYDRAALVALPPNTRHRYVTHLRALLAPGSRGIVITFDYEQGSLEPPPFAVAEAEVRELYEGARVETIDEGPADGSRFREAGVTAREHCFTVTT